MKITNRTTHPIWFSASRTTHNDKDPQREKYIRTFDNDWKSDSEH